MKVHYPKLYNMAHLSLNVFTAYKGSNNYILFKKKKKKKKKKQSVRLQEMCEVGIFRQYCMPGGQYIFMQASCIKSV